MGKRGMQSKEAMGVDAYEAMDKQLGHQHEKKFIPTLNASKEPKKKAAIATSAATPTPAAPAAPRKLTADEEFQQKQELKSLINQTETGIYSHFTDMYKAFQYMDLDRSGRLSKKEIQRALDLWNVPLDEDKLDLLMATCDQDGDGGISYEEFCDKLVRETVAPAAMGKRGMQSKEAMGVDAYEAMDEQLGHHHEKKFIPTLSGH